MIRKLLSLAVVAMTAVALVGLNAAPASAVTDAELCNPDNHFAYGTSGNDTIDKSDNTYWLGWCIIGRDGNDTLLGGYAMDYVFGDGWADEMYGNAASNTLNGGNADDAVYGGGNSDVLYGGFGDDIVHGDAGADNIFGGDNCQETGWWGYWYYDGPSPTVDCHSGGADVLHGNEGDDWIWESNSDNGGDGQVDEVWGGAGYDICIVEAIDTVAGCEEIHTIPTEP